MNMTVRNMKAFEQYLKPILAGRLLRYLEIGVYIASTSYWVWQNILTHPQSTATLVDPWHDTHGDRHHEMTRTCMESWHDRCQIFRMTSEQFFREVPDGTRYSVVLIDGDHSYDAVMLDASHVLDLVSDECVVVFDDTDLSDVGRALAEIEPVYAARGFRRLYASLFQVAFIRGFDRGTEA